MLLARDPLAELARVFAAQVRRKRISPYQTGGGVKRDIVFFGRAERLANILNGEPANYLVVGGRQLGKSSLLHAIHRRTQGHARIQCAYIALGNHFSERYFGTRLADGVGLPNDSGLDRVLAHLAAERFDGHRLILIDEADSLVRADREKNFQILSQLRGLSEEGRCFFILAGFWDLYRSAVFDYQSPLRNFGEIVQVGSLEARACRDLAVKPMRAMGLTYADAGVVDHLIAQTGQRANLVAITCYEILAGLTQSETVISGDLVQRALNSSKIRKALEGWQTLAGGDHMGNRLDRLVIYSTVERGIFASSDALSLLAERGHHVAQDPLRESLERLTLAHILGRATGGHYTYLVPLFNSMIRQLRPEELLADELE